GVIDKVATGISDVRRQPRDLVAFALSARLHQTRGAGGRPAVEAGAILGAQKARAAGADIDERRLELGHHPLEPAEEDGVSQRRPIAPHDLQLDQTPSRGQRHQERLRQHLADQAIDRAHRDADFSSARVSNSGRPTTLLYDPDRKATKAAARPWMA